MYTDGRQKNACVSQILPGSPLCISERSTQKAWVKRLYQQREICACEFVYDFEEARKRRATGGEKCCHVPVDLNMAKNRLAAQKAARV